MSCLHNSTSGISPAQKMPIEWLRMGFLFGGVIVMEPLALRTKIKSNNHREYCKKILAGDPVGEGQIPENQGEQDGDNAFNAE